MDYKADVVVERLVHQNDNRLGNTKDEAKLQKASDLLARMRCSKARKYLQSNGLSDHTGDAIV